VSQAQPDECSVCGKLKQYLEKGGRHFRVFMKVPGLPAGKERYIPVTNVIDGSLKMVTVTMFSNKYL
jgi:hypothetical protein